MASITNEPNGRRSVQFIGSDGKRRTVRLGKVSQRYAEGVKGRIEDLATANALGQSPQRDTVTWLAEEAGDVLRDRLAAVGLCERRGVATLAKFIDEYFASRTDAKPGMRVMWERNRGYLVGYFGAGKALRDITEGDADAYRVHLLRTLAENTVRRSCGMAKQLFRVAHRRRLVQSNPFADLSGSVGRNPERMYFVGREIAGKVLAACPDATWRLLFALARYGGLRIPSEAKGLRWADIDWERGRFTVESPKTAHQGKPTRVVPLFPELQPYLQAAFDEAEDGAVYVVGRRCDSAVNLRTHLQRIIRRAGVEAWPKLWQNLRATRATELADEFPSHVCAAWLGHTEAVADAHYRQTTDAHYDRAAGRGSALQNPVQRAHANERRPAQPATSKPDESALAAVSCSIDAETRAESTIRWAVLDSNQ